MPNLLADHDIEGHVKNLVDYFERSHWTEIWRHLEWTVFYFVDLELDVKSSDRNVWRRCQDEDMILITGNRNMDGPDSLEATIRDLNESHHLPVITIGKIDQYQNNGEYAEQVAEKCLEHFHRIDELRGTGRLYVP